MRSTRVITEGCQEKVCSCVGAVCRLIKEELTFITSALHQGSYGVPVCIKDPFVQNLRSFINGSLINMVNYVAIQKAVPTNGVDE